MNDLSVIDHFLAVFSTYIDSGFGLLRPEVAYLTATLVVIDITLAGLFWAFGGTDDVLARLIKKTLYVGAFAFIITNFSLLSKVVFQSFLSLGLVAAGSPLGPSQLLQPGRLASVGVDAARPILVQIGDLAGFPGVFLNIDSILVLGLAWLIVIVSFFVLAVQLFVTLIEFKLTTLAGFVLIPFALWNRTAFLAERVLGNIVSCGIKVLVLAIIVGVGSTIFGEFRAATPAEPLLNVALATMLGSLALLGLGIFGPGIATGLVSGAPQLGAGAAAGTALGVAGLGAAAGAVAAGTSRIVGRGAATLGSATSLAARARGAYTAGKAASSNGGWRGTAAGAANVVRTGVGDAVDRMRPAEAGSTASPSSSSFAASGADAMRSDAHEPPPWARRLQQRQRVAHGAAAAAHVLRGSDHGGAGASPKLDPDESR